MRHSARSTTRAPPRAIRPRQSARGSGRACHRPARRPNWRSTGPGRRGSGFSCISAVRRPSWRASGNWRLAHGDGGKSLSARSGAADVSAASAMSKARIIEPPRLRKDRGDVAGHDRPDMLGADDAPAVDDEAFGHARRSERDLHPAARIGADAIERVTVLARKAATSAGRSRIAMASIATPRRLSSSAPALR